jgi:hypothetical protein
VISDNRAFLMAPGKIYLTAMLPIPTIMFCVGIVFSNARKIEIPPAISENQYVRNVHSLLSSLLHK